MPLRLAAVLIPTRPTRRSARRSLLPLALAMVALAALAWRLTT
jgi:hypothetical protein